jgi:hypothetical protein
MQHLFFMDLVTGFFGNIVLVKNTEAADSSKMGM